LEALLAAEGGLLDRIYVCPHHPAPGRPTAVRELSIACECRKPGSLLFRRALAELPIDPIRSFAIGDSLRDIGAARAVGLPALGVRTGYGCTDIGRYPGGASAAPTPDQLFADVGSAVDYILSRPR
jgi:histidinol phosphatase-like enzyme